MDQERSRRDMIRRYIIFLTGLLVNSFGVAFITKAALGVSPISSIPYSMSLILPRLSLGNWTMIFNFTMILLQLMLLRGKIRFIEVVLQVLIAMFYGYFIDLSMLSLHAFLPQTYGGRMLSLLAGCAIIAMGAYLELVADVVMIPGDAFMRTVAMISHKEYGTIRVICDVVMAMIAIFLCLVFLGEMSGVREGTIIAAVLTGNPIKIYRRIFAGKAG